MVHLKRWTSFFKTFPVGPNRSIEFWTEISGNFGWWIVPYELTLLTYVSSFLSPEPVVSWSRGRETRGSGSSRYRMSENFWHPVAHVQKLQISLLMLITDFCPSPLHWGKNFTSRALSRECLLWGVLKMHHFTQLGFTDNLGLKEEDSNRNRLNTLLVCRTETINQQTIVWVMWVFFFNTFGEQTLGKQYREDRYNAGKSQSEMVSCSMSCNSSYWLQNAFWNETIHELC